MLLRGAAHGRNDVEFFVTGWCPRHMRQPDLY